VLGCATIFRKSKRKYVQIWAESLRRFNPDLRIVLLADGPIDREVAAIARREEVEVFGGSDREDANPILTRNRRYLAWLRVHQEVTEAICLDVFDVVCQGDLAGIDLSRGMWMTQENITVGACPFNRDWVSRSFGSGWLTRLAETPVICGGAFGGVRSELMLYLHGYEEDLLARSGEDVTGLDQSYLNVWAALDGGGVATVLPYRNHQCVHMGYAPVSEFACDAEGIWMEGRSTRPLLLHQWNRRQHAAIERYLRETYPYDA
jgi:hypothetical protein